MFTALLFQAIVEQAPTKVSVQLQSNPADKLLQIVLSVAVICTTVFTFLLGHRKRIRERRAGWYHQVVVDEVLPKLFEFFTKIQPILHDLALDCMRAGISNRKTLPSKVTKTLADVSEQIFVLQDVIVDRLIVFDEESTEALRGRCESFQDEITEWFETCLVKKRGDVEGLRGIQLRTQRDLIRILYDSEFRNF